MSGDHLPSALFQWRDGERRLRELPSRVGAVDAVLAELRRRLGSRFSVEELAGYYAREGDWAATLAAEAGAAEDASWVADAAFARYAREAADYAGGRVRV